MTSRETFIQVVKESPTMQRIEALFQELLSMSIIELIDFREKYGEFATHCLMTSRIKAYHSKDPMREAIKEMHDDIEFMENIPAELRRQVASALNAVPN